MRDERKSERREKERGTRERVRDERGRQTGERQLGAVLEVTLTGRAFTGQNWERHLTPHNLTSGRKCRSL